MKQRRRPPIFECDIPNKPMICPHTDCVYNGEVEPGQCLEPWINYGNGDAKCHTWRPRKVIEILKEVNTHA